MLKAIVQLNGRTTLLLGLSFKNLDKFRAEPGDTFIPIDGKAMNLPIDVLLFSGETEAHMAEMMKDHISLNTIIHVDPKLKS